MFANPDGTWTSETNGTPSYVKDQDGQWHDVDPTLVQRDGHLQPAYATTDLTLSNGGDTTFASVTEDGKKVDFHWPTTLPTPVVDGNVATYSDAVPGGGDLVVTAGTNGFHHDIVLHHAPSGAQTSDPSWTIPVATHGAVLDKTEDGGLEVATTGGDPIMTADPPVMYDSAGGTPATDAGDATDPDNPVTDPVDDPETNVAPLATTVGENAAGTATMTLTADKDFLTDPSTVYPVVVDPNFVDVPSSDTWVESSHPNQQNPSDASLMVGYNGAYAARSFVAFTWSNIANLQSDTIQSATMTLRNYSSLSCAGSAIRAERLTEPWSVNDGISWNNQPSFATNDYSQYSPAHGGPNCTYDDAIFPMKPIVTYWAAHPAQNYGVRIKAVDETTTDSWREYRSANYATASVSPRLSITYSPPPNAPTSLFAVDGQPLSALVSSDNVTVSFDIVSSTGATTTVKSSEVDAGQRASVALPAGLAAGRYTVRATCDDGSLKSTSVATTTLVVDPSAAALVDSKAIATQAITSGASAMTGHTPAASTQTSDAATALQNDADIPAPVALQEATAAQAETSDHLAYVGDLADTYIDSGLQIDESVVTVSVDSSSMPTATSAQINLTATYDQTIDDIDTGNGDKYITASGDLAPLNPDATADDEADTSTFDDQYVATFTFTAHNVTTPAGIQVLAYYIPTLTDLTQASPADASEGDDGSVPGGETAGTTETDPSDAPSNPPGAVTGDSPESADGGEGDDGGEDETLLVPDPGDALSDNSAEADGQPLTAAEVGDTATTSLEPSGDSGDSVNSVQSAASYTASYDRLAVARYALTWTNAAHRNKMNSDYPTFDDNCANFVSQALRAGGWPTDGGLFDTPRNLTTWHYNLPGPFGATHTWSGAKYLLGYAYSQKHLNAAKYITDLVPGDLIFFDWHANNSVNHAMVVTGRTKKGMPMLSGKTNNRHNIPWATFNAIALRDYGVYLVYGLGHLKTS